MKKLLFGLALFAVPFFAGATVVDQCNAEFNYTKSADFSDTRVLINFESNDNQIDVSAQTGYAVIDVSLQIADDGHPGFWQYATGPVNNFNPNPGTTIQVAKVTVKKVCAPPLPVDVCSNIEGNQATTPEGYNNVGGICTPIPPPDVCSNLEGNQATTPEGYTNNDGVCTPVPNDDDDNDDDSQTPSETGGLGVNTDNNRHSGGGFHCSAIGKVLTFDPKDGGWACRGAGIFPSPTHPPVCAMLNVIKTGSANYCVGIDPQQMWLFAQPWFIAAVLELYNGIVH